jgi:hypothetical protein
MPNTYFNRTPASAGNRRTWTYSAWFKRATHSVRNALIGSTDTSNSGGGGGGFGIRFDDDNGRIVAFAEGAVSFYLVTTQIFRDLNAWYHIVFSVDTTQATASNRFKIYVNGEQLTVFNSATYMPQNFQFQWNTTSVQYIGAYNDGGISYHNNGSMASIYSIDGQALTPSSFGQTDATTGIWKPKSYSGSYGTNGFFLKFENSASLGTDSSGNGNNFTVNGTPTQTVDTPSNVFCTLNAIQSGSSISTLTNGNLTAGTNDNKGVAGTLGVNKGKWYWEIKNSGTQTNQRFGVSNRANEQDGDASPTGDTANVRSYVGLNYQKNYSASSGTTNTSFVGTNGAIFGFALDLDNGTLGRYVNGTLISTDTTLPSNNSVTFFPFTFVTYNAGNWNLAQFNFGNGYFGSTAISSPFSDGAGLGKFQYQPPTGYYSLCTKNINIYG